MSKNKKIILGILSSLFILFIVYNNLVQNSLYGIYTIQTISSSPTLEVGDKIIVSKLFKPNRNDFISYKRVENLFGNGYIDVISRLIATENDTILIKNGIVFVNGINIDKNLSLKHNYVLPSEEYSLNKQLFQEKQEFIYQISNETYIIQLEDHIASKLKLQHQTNDNPVDITQFKQTPKSTSLIWTIDNFGPYIVPENHFFTLGDNRDNSMDSRTHGPIPFNQYNGKIINHN